MKLLSPTVVCWAYNNRERFPFDEQSVHVLDFPTSPLHSSKRWLIRCQNLTSGNFYGTVGRERAALLSLMRETRPDVIFCHYGHCALRLLPIAEEGSIPLVAHFNGLDLASALKNDRWYRRSLKQALDKFAGIVVVGEHQRSWMRRNGVPEEKLHLIPYGVPIAQFQPSHGVPKQPCRFLSVGRFVPKKAPLNTIRAFASCAKNIEGLTLRMVGDGPMLDAAGNMAKQLGVEDRVEFLGSLPNEAVQEEMTNAAVFVQHSMTPESGDMEGWPVAIGEAVASGLPVVATLHGGIPQQVVDGKTGYLVNEGDWHAMGEAMGKLARDPDLRTSFGAKARAMAVEQFDIDRQVAQLEDVLINAAKRRIALEA